MGRSKFTEEDINLTCSPRISNRKNGKSHKTIDEIEEEIGSIGTRKRGRTGSSDGWNSVWKQSDVNFEIIVVDDGSPDGTQEIVKQLQQVYGDDRIMVINNLRGEPIRGETKTNDEYYDENEPLRGMNEEDYDMWEEWMGSKGAGIRDYSSHINPYI